MREWKSPPPSTEDKGYLVGRQLKPRELAAIFHRVGFRGEDLIIMVATCLSESQGYSEAYHDNVENGKLLSRDVGIGQINIPRRMLGTRYEFKLNWPIFNARVCFDYYKDRGFRPWHGFTRGLATDPKAKGRYIHRAIEGVANFYAEKYKLQPVPFLEERK